MSADSISELSKLLALFCESLSHDMRGSLGVASGVIRDLSEGYTLEKADIEDALTALVKLELFADALKNSTNFIEECSSADELRQKFPWNSISEGEFTPEIPAGLVALVLSWFAAQTPEPKGETVIDKSGLKVSQSLGPINSKLMAVSEISPETLVSYTSGPGAVYLSALRLLTAALNLELEFTIARSKLNVHLKKRKD